MTRYSPERIEAARRGHWGNLTLKQRFYAKVVVDPITGCWLWTASVDNRGYGQMNVNGKPTKAHRVAWMIYEGQLPEPPLTLDHICRVVRCVNPEHLEPVTRSENTRRQLKATGHHNAKKMGCPKGHPFDAGNTRYASRGYGRVCRICRAESSRKYRANKKAAE